VLDSVVFYTPWKDGSYANEYPQTVTAVSDGYVVTGSTEYNTQWATGGLENISDLMHVKFDFSLQPTTELDTTRSNSQNELGFKSVELSSGRIYSFGSSYKEVSSTTNNNFNFWVLPVPILANNDYAIGLPGVGNDEQVTAVCETEGQGYFLAGTHVSAGVSRIYVGSVYEDNSELYVSQLAGQGIVEVPGHAGANLVPAGCAATKVGSSGYLILANEGDEGFRNIWLTKVSGSNLTNVLWASSFGSPDRNDDTGVAVAELPDGRILVLGTVNFGSDNFKMALFKLSKDGKLAN